ncbi:carbohydrate ABC transporter permease [Vallitalea maricola]|uniref:Sugar ABC transporter permease n=1 Tax=Vallitalea maricola TaxID=3074433 RepID=A0ACB5UHA1_9FIRM|nr:sugar ABC transporter permease [Vallitalea sp. AN17-2]
MKRLQSKRILGVFEFLLFTIPALAFVLFSTNIPFLMNIYYSVFKWNGISKNMQFVGLKNFVHVIFNDSTFLKSAVFTMKFTFFYVILANIISLAVALVLAKEMRSSKIGRVFYYIPYIISLTAISLIWKFLVGPGFEAMYTSTGFEFFDWSWMGTPKLAFYIVVIMQVWRGLGFYMVTYIAGIIVVPKDILEAASIDGASKFQVLKHVLLPSIMPSITICVMTSLINAFKLFDIILVFTKGGPANSTASVAYNIYNEAFINSNYGLATAKSLLFFVSVLVVTLLQLKLTKSREIEV